ncbi:MAG TPA: WD40 repeat domain-containing serine/threonine protein kinase [Rudaea sp.]|nr:WD40 repeat domain-containing serine/threonine protein kinase [Rudaea sp.]
MNARSRPESLHAVVASDPLPSMVLDAGGIADLVFGNQTVELDSDEGRPLALLSAEALEVDLSDPQQRQFGDYELLEKIGEGGMGVVYRARQTSLEREVALKLLAAGPWASRDFIERFRREAQNAARMQHPNIVAIYEVGDVDELHYFSMRLVHGGSLAALLKRDGKLDPHRAAQLLRTIAEAVDYAHRLGVLHLDLKPANVLIDDNGTAHVADFGLARRLEQCLIADNNEISGTPSYMAPEQATAGPQKITPATDIWGLGAIGYELVTGQPPYSGKTPHETLKLVVEGQLRNPRRYTSELPRDLEAIILKCMAYDTAQRYPSARDLAEDLTRFQNGYMVKARPLNTLQRSARWAQREPKIVATALFALLALLIGLIATTAQWRRANTNAQHAEAERALATNSAAISSERLWDGRRDAAIRLMRDGKGFDALAPLIANIGEKQAAGKNADLERREIGMIEHQGVTLIDRFIIPEANPMAAALSPDGTLLAVTLNDLSVRWYDTATLTERGRLDLLNNMDPDQVPILPRFIDDHHLMVNGEWFEFLPSPSTSGGVLIDLDHARAIAPPKQFADLADITWSSDARHALLHDKHGQVQLWQVDPWRPLSALAQEMAMVGMLWVLDPQLRYAVQFGRNMSELRVFDPRRLDRPHPVPMRPHESFSAWATSHAGALLAVGTSNGQTFLIDMRSRAVRQVPGPLGSRVSWLSFSEDDAWLAAARSDGAAFTYDVATDSQLHAGQMQADFDATRVEIDHRSHLLILSGQIAGGTGDAQIWHIPKEGPMLGVATHVIASPPREGRAGPYWLSSAPNAGLLASAAMNGEVRLWRLPKSIVLDAKPALLVSDNTYTDGDHVVDVAYDHLRVVSTGQGTATPWLPLPPPIVFAQLVDDSKTLVAVARTGLHVLDAATLKPRVPAIALDNTPQHMVVSANGRFAGLSFNHNGGKGFEERIERYDLNSGKRTDPGDVAVAAPLRQFLLSADASRLLTIGPAEGATQVFDANTLKLLFAYPHDPAQPVIRAGFTTGARDLWMVTRNTDDTQADNADLMRVDLATGHIVEKRHVPGVYPVGMTTVGDKPLLAGRDRVVLDPGAPDAHAVTGLRGGEATTIFAVSRDDRLVAHAFGDGVQLYSATDLTPIGSPLPLQTGTMQIAVALAFSNDGQHLFANIDPPVSSNWIQWPIGASRRSVDELRSETALLEPRDAGPRVLAMADARDRKRLRARDPGPPASPLPRPAIAVARWIGADPIPARDPDATPWQLDLGAFYNRAPTSALNVMNTVIPAMSDTPFGLPRIDSVDYDWRGALEMRQDGGGLSVGDQYRITLREIVRGLRVPGVPIAAFHVLLYAPESIGESRERVYANVRLHYRDGSEAVLPLRTQREVKGWTDHDRPTPIGWSMGEISRVLGLMHQITFNDPRVTNPHPDKIVESLDLETLPQDWSTPVFFAITAEPVIAGRDSRMDLKGTAGNDPATDDAKR